MKNRIYVNLSGIVNNISGDTVDIDVYCSQDSEDVHDIQASVHIGENHRCITTALQVGDAVNVTGWVRQVAGHTLAIDEISTCRVKTAQGKNALLSMYGSANDILKDYNDATRCVFQLPMLFDGFMAPDNFQFMVRSNPGSTIQAGHDNCESPADIYGALKPFGENQFQLDGRLMLYKGLPTCEIFAIHNIDDPLGPVENHFRAHFEVYDKKAGLWHHSSEPLLAYGGLITQAILSMNVPFEITHELPEDLSRTTQARFDRDWYLKAGAVSQITCLDKSALMTLKTEYPDDFANRWEFWNESRLDDIRLVCWVVTGRHSEISEK